MSEENTQPNEEVPAMPTNGEAKFYNAESGEYDWRSHAVQSDYRVKELRGNPATEKAPAGEPSADPATEDKARQAVANAGLDWTSVMEQVSAMGDILPETRAKLIESGTPSEAIDLAIQGRAAMVENINRDIVEYCGGDEAQWNAMRDFAANNLTPQEQDSIAELMGNGNHRVAIDALRARMGMVAPTGAGSPNGLGVNPAYGGNPLMTQEDIAILARSREVQTDPVKRAQYNEALKNSPAFEVRSNSI